MPLEDYFQLLAEELVQQRNDAHFRLLYAIPPSSRQRSLDLPVETLTQLADLLDEEGTEIRQLFYDAPEDDHLIMSTEDLFAQVLVGTWPAGVLLGYWVVFWGVLVGW